MQELDFSKVRAPIKLNIDLILSKISEAEVMLRYCGSFKIGKVFKSPIGKDSNPSARIVASTNGNLLLQDFRYGVFNCWQLVKRLYNCNFDKALQIVAQDFGIIGEQKYQSKSFYKEVLEIDSDLKKETLIQFEPAQWSKKNLKYWADYGITQELLERNNVYAIKDLFINRIQVSNITTPRYAYIVNWTQEDKYKSGVKIYAPLATKFKWMSSIPLNIVGDLDKLDDFGDICWVAKSKKDSMVLQNFYKNVVWTGNESFISFPKDIREDLQKRFKRVVLSWGADPQGVETCTHYNQYGCHYFNTPKSDYDKFEIEDCADFVKMWGYKALEQLLKNKGFL